MNSVFRSGFPSRSFERDASGQGSARSGRIFVGGNEIEEKRIEQVGVLQRRLLQ